MHINVLRSKSRLNNFCRYAAYNRIWKTTFNDNGTCCNDRALTDCNSFENSHLGTDPYIILYYYRSIILG